MKSITKVVGFNLIILFTIMSNTAFALDDTCPDDAKSENSIGPRSYFICTFAAPGEMDTYRIQVNKGDRISVAVAVLELRDEESSSPRPSIEILNPDGSKATRSSWGYYGAFNSARVNNDGVATVIVTDDAKETLQYSVKINCTGLCGSNSLLSGNAYQEGYDDGLNASTYNSLVSLSREQDTCPLAQPLISSGTYFICSFIAPGEMDAYRISVNKGDRVTVAVGVLDVTEDPVYTSTTPSPSVKIINPDGSIAVDTWDYHGVNSSAEINTGGEATIIVVDEYLKNTIQYSVQINCTGTCSGNSDGDDYLAGYENGFKGKASDIPKEDSPQAEDFPEPIIKTSDDNLNIEIGLDSGSELGTLSDWWLVANTLYGWFSYDLGSGSWIPGINVTYQDALFSFDLFSFFNIPGLPEGTLSLYFGVDTLMNGVLDMDLTHYDSLEVTEKSENCNPIIDDPNFEKAFPVIKEYIQTSLKLAETTDGILQAVTWGNYEGTQLWKILNFAALVGQLTKETETPFEEINHKNLIIKLGFFTAEWGLSSVIGIITPNLSGVTAWANLASLPVTSSIFAFKEKVDDHVIKKQLQLYFFARNSGCNYDSIINDNCTDATLSFTDNGWLIGVAGSNIPCTYFGCFPSWPLQPAEFYEYAEFLWKNPFLDIQKNYENDEKLLKDILQERIELCIK